MNPDAAKWRRTVLARDRGFCCLCHSMERLEAHHILPFRSCREKRWDVTNGITLCFWCHRAMGRREADYAAILSGIAAIPVAVWPRDQDLGRDPAQFVYEDVRRLVRRRRIGKTPAPAEPAQASLFPEPLTKEP